MQIFWRFQRANERPSDSRKILILFLCVAAIGFWLRVRGMEYASFGDDQFLALKIGQNAYEKGEVPIHGMYSSVGVDNPPGSAVVFGAIFGLSRLFSSSAQVFERAIAMSWWVGALNFFALALFFLLLRRTLTSAKEALPLFAILAVAPWPVHWSRAVWAQEFLLWFIFPAFAFAARARSLELVASFGYVGGEFGRRSTWREFRKMFGAKPLRGDPHREAAFFWIAALVMAGLSAQIHISGFFSVFAFGIWFLGRSNLRAQTKALVVLAAAGLTLIHLFPWLGGAFQGLAHRPATVWSWNLIEAKLRLIPQLVKMFFGLGWVYSLGPEHLGIWRYPFQGWTLFWTAISALSGMSLIWVWLRRFFSRHEASRRPKIQWQRWDADLLVFFISYSAIALVVAPEMHPHYLIPLMVLTWWLVARVATARLFIPFVLAQLMLTLTFQSYLFTNGGNPGGPYGIGVGFKEQPCAEGKWPAPTKIFPILKPSCRKDL